MPEQDRDQSRRGFLKAATIAIGGAMGAVVGIPLIRYFLHPVGRKIVSAPDAPIDIAGVDEVVAGAAPVKLPVVASGVRDAWGVSGDVAVGSAWVHKEEDGTVKAFSSVCPHLGCAVAFDEGDEEYKCPCHRSAFKKSGEKISGPSKRGLDPLEVTVEDGRIKVVYKRYRSDVPEREPV
jgi:Rieske Fe-S protein